jgi:hypothetical protein
LTDLYLVNETIKRGIKFDLLAFFFKKIGTREGKKGYLIKVSSDKTGERTVNIYCFKKPKWDKTLGKADIDQWYLIKNLYKNDEGFVYFNDDSSIQLIPDISKFDVEGYRDYQSENKPDNPPTPPEPKKSEPESETKTKSHNDPISDAYKLIIDGLDMMRSGFEVLLKVREDE